MSSLQPFHSNFISNFIPKLWDKRFFLFVISGCCDINSASAAYANFIIFLRIEIQKDFTFQKSSFQAHGASHSCFFINGKQCLDGWMGNVLAFQNGHNGGNPQAIIRSKRGAFGPYPIAIHIHINALCIKIELSIVIFLVHHIEM